jgi:23S rRNA (cytidine1920-2'-O)/16S rRNA (cytidine1409-2'-O)-methyltransferase
MPDPIQEPSDAQTLKQDRVRLDILLTQAKMVRSRTEAQELIAAGLVLVDGRQILKSGQSFANTSKLEISGQQRRFVSRGGEKLEAALIGFNISVHGKKCLDVGASTGGFTDCLLQYQAAHVTAIDVGHGQLDPTIAANPKVDSREGINVRNLTQNDLLGKFDIIVVDLSFISLRLVLPALLQFLSEEGDLICLVKPQFEVGRQALGRGGIVRSEVLRSEALINVQESASAIGYRLSGSMESPLRGGDGNVEFLIHLKPEEPLCKTKNC